MAITLDGTSYNVRVVYDTMTREFALMEGANSGVSINGTDILDIIGTKYTYQMNVEPVPSDQASYDSFYQAISNPNPIHTVTLPYGQSTISFSCKVMSGSDKYRGVLGGTHRWAGLTVSFVPIAPQRT